jgi:hypothetical protein
MRSLKIASIMIDNVHALRLDACNESASWSNCLLKVSFFRVFDLPFIDKQQSRAMFAHKVFLNVPINNFLTHFLFHIF